MLLLVPIKAAASALSLPVHEIDTFTGWTVIPRINQLVLTLTVLAPDLPEWSYQLDHCRIVWTFRPAAHIEWSQVRWLKCTPLVTTRVCDWYIPGLKMKITNWLTSFRGPAPLHHTLLAGETTTGVTVQTLHHESFDHGVILSQTPAPGFDIPNPNSCTVPELLNLVAPKGAQMLVESIDKGLYVPPIKDVGQCSTKDTSELIHASKIIPEDRHINWAEWSSANIARRNRVIGPLWSKALCATNAENAPLAFQQKRVIFTEIEEVDLPDNCESFSILPGLPFTNSYLPDEPGVKRHLYVFTADGKVLRINRMKVEGEKDSNALAAAHKARMFDDKGFQYGDWILTPFRNPFV